MRRPTKPKSDPRSLPRSVLILVELFARSAIDGRGDKLHSLQAIHELVVPFVPRPIGYDEIAIVEDASPPEGEG